MKKKHSTRQGSPGRRPKGKRPERVVVLAEGHGLRVTARPNEFVKEVHDMVCHSLSVILRPSADDLASLEERRPPAESVEESLDTMLGGEIEVIDVEGIAASEIAARLDEFQSTLKLQISAFVDDAVLSLASAANEAALRRIAGMWGEKLRLQELASFRRPFQELIKQIRKGIADRLTSPGRGGTTRTSKIPELETLRAYRYAIDRFTPIWRLLLTNRRSDPANWKALAGPIGKSKGLNKTDEAGMLEVSDAIGNLRKNINGAAVEPKTCAREHARIVLGIEKRSDTKLRELEKISRGINASDERTETP